MTSNNSSQPNDLRDWLAQANAAILFKVTLLFFGSIAVVFLLAWLIFTDRAIFPLGADQVEPLFAVDAVDSLAQPGLVELEVDGVNLGVVQRLDPPQLIEVSGFQLRVSNRYLSDNELWQTVALPPNQVGWLENSIVNYVFRLPSGRGYRDILENVKADEGMIRVATAEGKQLLFAPSELGKRPLSATNTPLPQNKPSITLIWVDEGDEKTVFFVTGEYVSNEESLQQVGLTGQHLGSAIGETALAAPLSISLEQADVQENGLQLMVQGSIINRGIEPQTITAQDIQLSTNGLISQIISAEPPLPWQLSPNNSQILFTVTFQKPPGSNALLRVGSQPYSLVFD